jgi:hypothetical protein
MKDLSVEYPPTPHPPIWGVNKNDSGFKSPP